MKRSLYLAALLVAGSCEGLLALDRADLSAEAQKLVPEDKAVNFVLKDGRRVQGTVVREMADRIVLKERRSGSISVSREYMKTNIQSSASADVCPILAERLLEFKTEPTRTLTTNEYHRILSLLDEFLQKGKGTAEYEEVRKRRAEFADELDRVNRGMVKVDVSTWMAPVRAAVRRFDLYTAQIKELESGGGAKVQEKTNKKPYTLGDSRQDVKRIVPIVRERPPEVQDPEKIKKTLEELVDKRRAVARGMPMLMQSRLPQLIDQKSFDEAVAETMTFLQFWVDQVIRSEGPAADVIRKMDFDYIMRLENQIMDAYRKEWKPPSEPAGARGPKDADMIYVPGGYFLMGRPDAGPQEDDFPVRIVYVSPFLIDRYEVSNQAYRDFVEHVKKTGDASMEHPDAPPLKKHEAEGWKNRALSGDAQPVVGVDWFDAYACAKWMGKRLATEAEWECAARGMDGRRFPWGDKAGGGCTVNYGPGRNWLAGEMDRQNPPKPPPAPAARFGCSCVKKKNLPPPPPTALPAVTWAVDKALPPEALKAVEEGLLEWDKQFLSPCGALHMAGNAAEWVADWYEKDAYSKDAFRDPSGPKAGTAHVIRGGSYLSDKDDDISTFRRSHPTDEKGKTGCDKGGRPFVGFRCAKSIEVVRKAAP